MFCFSETGDNSKQTSVPKQKQASVIEHKSKHEHHRNGTKVIVRDSIYGVAEILRKVIFLNSIFEEIIDKDNNVSNLQVKYGTSVCFRMSYKSNKVLKTNND